MRFQRGIFSRGIPVLAGLGAALLLGGCGGGGGDVTLIPGTPATPANAVAVSDAAGSRVVVKWDIVPSATNYKIFRTPPLSVAPALAKPRAVKPRAVKPRAAAGGLIGSSAQGEYDDTAVQDGITYTYEVAASNASGDSQPSVGVAVTYHAVPGISINPVIPSLLPGGTTTFTATVTGLTGPNAGAVVWSVQEGVAGGSITPAGVYTAPATVGTYHVVAVSQADPTRQAVATVLVGTSNGSTTVTVQ